MKNLKIHENQHFDNFRHAVERFAEMYGYDTAFSFRIKPHDKEIVRKSFNALRDDVRSLGSKLLALGAHGKHIAVIGKTTYEWVVSYYATLAIGSTLVPLDRDWSKEELAETAKRADVQYLIVDADIREKGEFIKEAIGLDTFYTLEPVAPSTLTSLAPTSSQLSLS